MTDARMGTIIAPMPNLIADLSVILWLSYIANALLSLILASSGPKFKGAWLWVIAQSLMALATVCDGFASGAPPWVSAVLGNSLYAGASIFYSHSVWVFSKQEPFPHRLYFLIPLQVLTFLFAATQTYLIQTTTFSVWMSIGPLMTGIILLKNLEARYGVARYLTTLPFLVLSASSFMRIILILVSAGTGTVVAASPLNAWYIGGAILLSTIMLFGYFMLSAVRHQQELEEKDREIRARNEQLLEANKAKDLFFTIVAHDLRAPIGGAARYARKHLFGKLTGLEAKYSEVETLTASLEKTNDFLEKLLWWSRAQLQDWTPSMERISLGDCVRDSINMVSTLASVKNISIKLGSSPPPEVSADPESIKLVLSNLLSNAIKFSKPDQEIRIHTIVEGDSGCIIIEDDGIGMDRETISRLFRIENKLSTLGTQNERGSGLGLILAKSLIERNCGSISLASSPGVGTKATIRLPLNPGCPETIMEVET